MSGKRQALALGLGQHGIGRDESDRRVLGRAALVMQFEIPRHDARGPAEPAEFIALLIGPRPRNAGRRRSWRVRPR